MHQMSSTRVVSARVTGVESLPALDPLIEAYPFKSYRNYRVLSRRRQDDVLRAELRAALEQPDGFGVMSEGTASPAAVLVRPLPWDSAFFGLSMARVYLLHDDQMRGAILRTLLAAAFTECRDRGMRHLSVRIDVADADAIHALEDAGFRLMDALATYIYPLKRPPPESMKEMAT